MKKVLAVSVVAVMFAGSAMANFVGRPLGNNGNASGSIQHQGAHDRVDRNMGGTYDGAGMNINGLWHSDSAFTYKWNDSAGGLQTERHDNYNGIAPQGYNVYPASNVIDPSGQIGRGYTMGFLSGHDYPAYTALAERAGIENGSSQWLEYAFDGVYSLTDVHVWNFNEDTDDPGTPNQTNPPNNTWSAQGIKNVGVYIATNGKFVDDGFGSNNPNDWTHVGDFVLDQGTERNNLTAQLIAINADAKYVVFTFPMPGPVAADNPNYSVDHFGVWGPNGSNEIGIAEVRFAFVPEPSTFALLGLGALLMFVRRRR
jgi:hypothetical protein